MRKGYKKKGEWMLGRQNNSYACPGTRPLCVSRELTQPGDIPQAGKTNKEKDTQSFINWYKNVYVGLSHVLSAMLGDC